MLGYLINQYPMASQTFIRREIAAIEGTGRTVKRYAIRGWGTDLVDAEDRAEAARTRRLLDGGVVPLLWSLLRTAIGRPLLFTKALATAWRVGGGSRRGRLLHLAYLGEACLLRQWLVRDGVRHLHVHFGSNSATVALLCRYLGGPEFSFTVHGPEEFDEPAGLALGEKVAAAKFAVAICSFGRSQLWRWTRPELWSRVQVVRCGVDPRYLQEPATPVPGVKRLVNIGRMVEQKGQLLLLEAAARLRERIADFSVVVIGGGELRGEIERRIQALGLQDHVILAGWQDGAAVRSHLEAARGLVMPSFAEGLPVVIMESLARQRPVIATQIAGISELVRPGQTGWLIQAGDVEALAQAMFEMFEAPTQLLDRMGAAGAALVRDRHDARKEAARLLELVSAPAVGA